MTRRRPSGRIGGLVHPSPARSASEGLLRALGPGARLLDPDAGAPLVVDWDACWWEGKRIEELSQWSSLAASGRLGEVNGAFVLARRVEGEVRLTRDAIGERTLYYAKVPGGWIFASTIHALLASGLVPRQLDPRGIAAYLSYAYSPGEETLVEGVREVLAGEEVRLPLGGGTVRKERFWSLPPELDAAEGARALEREEELRQQLRAELEGAVSRRLPPGEKVGAFLSGGLDSSLVVALAKRLHDHEVVTWSVSFGPEYRNELPFSSLVAEHCGTQHHIVELAPNVILRHLDETIALHSDPIGDPLTVPNALLFREAETQVGVVLNGEGGDPCFGGPKNLPMLLAELYGDMSIRDEEPLARERSYLRAHQKCFDDFDQALSPKLRQALEARPLEESLAPLFADPRWKTFVGKLQALNLTLKGAHHILHKVDEVSAPFGVLPRAPLFDRGVVELAFQLPPQFKLKGSVEKYLLKRAVEDILPRAIIDRPKSGMLVPVEGWFQGPLLPEARSRLLDGLQRWELFDRRWLERLLSGKLGGLRPRHGVKIWLLITLEAWLRKVLAP
ncbi:asparagine synthetase B family protein [Hyalangium rubrum]|uniref:asparagine synthase (glutamine-hydrolyzing) n=1 Tax=Hyalangium rubrum TaxID=3103134 RepID=A0ABU5HC16_9BACT|nr:asparagine synthase-related protein [Hyalangium sp. s54d21]MDY7231006.1 asparagine synthase-related protein [Hyalangium sp. s54d21]